LNLAVLRCRYPPVGRIAINVALNATMATPTDTRRTTGTGDMNEWITQPCSLEVKLIKLTGS